MAMRKKWYLYLPGAAVLLWMLVIGSLRASMASALAEWEIGRAYVLRMNDVIWQENDIGEEAGDLQQQMLQDPALKKIAAMYMDASAESIALERPFQIPDISAQQKRLADSTMKKLEGLGLSADREKLLDEENEAAEALSFMAESLTEDSWILMQYPWIRWAAVLYYCTVTPLPAMVLAAAAAVLFLLAWKKTSSFSFGAALVITGVIQALPVSGIVRMLSMPLTNAVLGRSVNLPVTWFIVTGLVTAAAGGAVMAAAAVRKNKRLS